MTPRQVKLIAELVEACWAHDQKRGADILVELLGDRVHPEIVDRIKSMTKEN